MMVFGTSKILKIKNPKSQNSNLMKFQTIQNSKTYHIGKKYEFLDNVFLNVLKKHPDQMPKIFLNMFKAPSKTVIKFLSNKSNFLEDLSIIFKMPKWIFIKALFD